MAKEKKGETPDTNGKADEPKIVQRELPVKLSEAELAEAGVRLAKVDNDILEVDRERKDVAAGFRQRLKDLRARSKELAEQVESGSLTRMVDCEVVEDLEHGHRRYVRTDTGEEAEELRETLTAADLQEDWLEGQRGEGSDEGAAEGEDNNQEEPASAGGDEAQPTA